MQDQDAAVATSDSSSDKKPLSVITDMTIAPLHSFSDDIKPPPFNILKD